VLYAFGFATISVVLSDLHFVDPNPRVGQEGAEQGVRLELRRIRREAGKGSLYAACRIVVDAPLWRVDLLESVLNPGSLDRAHYHPRFHGWDPVPRRFIEDMTADPVAWLSARLSDLDGVLEEAHVEPDDVDPSDVAELRLAVPAILTAVQRLLDVAREPWQTEVHNEDGGVRDGWL
jgi:hypothetical protein